MPSRNIVHGRGVGSKSRIRVERPGGSSCAQHACKKYKLLHSRAKNALLKHLATAAGMRNVMYMFEFKLSQKTVFVCKK